MSRGSKVRSPPETGDDDDDEADTFTAVHREF